MSAGRWRAATLGATALLAVCCVQACGKTGAARGGLMLVISTDDALPLDRLEIDVTSKGKVLLHNNYRVPAEASLPATVAIVSNGDATAQAQISVVAWRLQPGNAHDLPLDRRDAIVTQIPTDRVASLRVVLSGRCSDKVTLDADGNALSTCGQGQTCDAGDCRPAEVLASELPDFSADETNVSTGGSSSSGGQGAGGNDTDAATCAGVVCDTPPDNDCEGDGQFRAHDKVGSCEAGVCKYASQLVACPCENHACTTDPCLTVTCASPPKPRCKDANTLTTFAANGTCALGSCVYAPSDIACEAATPQCKAGPNAAKCVECLVDADCKAGVACDTVTGTCVMPPSCKTLGNICGPGGNAGCCASNAVPGGTFNRFNNAAYPSKLSDFRLDTYEITVGRFRPFLAAYAPDMIAKGAGKNPNNPDDAGWDIAWNASMFASRADIDALFSSNCAGRPPWWTLEPGAPEGESMPVSCMTWLLAQAFCIWDGGRLPTEAEWSYAATGGGEQRQYPWGNKALVCSLARYNDATCGVAEADGPARVGSFSPQGDGKFGHADLAGNMWELVQDWYVDPAPLECNDCASLTPTSGLTLLGGSWFGNPTFLHNSQRRTFYTQLGNSTGFAGARCARSL